MVPTNFRDAECCLTCDHSEVLYAKKSIDSAFLNCTKFDTTCEDTTTCDEWQLKKDE
jgi:hypothetical protein